MGYLKIIFKWIKQPYMFLVFWAQKNKIYLKDTIFLKLLYRNMMHKKLNLDNPQTFNEKLQWLKIYDRNERYTKMVDKYEVKKYISNIIGQEYIIPTLGVWEKFDDIDFEKLPNQFVLKCTHDSGSTIICREKRNFNYKEARKKINYRLKTNQYYLFREWVYSGVKPRIIVEKYMETEGQKNLRDYKFFCFNGEAKFLYVSEGLENPQTARISFADMEYNKTEFYRGDAQPFKELPPKPKNFEKMKQLANFLSKDIPFVRVDFYEINGRIYFGELTFFPHSGYMPFVPQEYDKIVGDMLILPDIKARGNSKNIK